MNDTDTIKALTALLKKYPFAEKEEEAILNAIGILSWTKLNESWVKNRKRREDEKRRID